MRMKRPLEVMALATVSVCLLKLLMAGVVLSFGARSINLGVTPDAGVLGALLGPVLAAYTTSLHKSFRDDNKNGIPDDEESPIKK